ncbi:FAD-dependent monooxygenase [Mycobacterium sp. URHB0021]|jgi:2-polyprenyl-6-methoxyphenol hydroxylase-like FAD-dependent oxidoreductase
MATPSVLISGAGIAGPSLAFWLTRNGYRVTIVELADGLRPGGQTVDLRGAGGDVVDVLYQATKGSADYRFGTRVQALDQRDGGVDVTLSDGTAVSADLVVGADGPHSAVRRLAFGPEERFVKPLGGYHAWFSAPDTAGLDGWFLIYQEPGLNASMRPSHDPATAKAGLAFRSEPLTYDRRNADEQKDLLRNHFAGAGWQCDALLSAADEAGDFYFDAFVQVRMPTISQGRVTLVGDAGYCASPLSGMGTSLALVGAYVLAGELGAADSLDVERIRTALARTEALMRPYIDRCQDLPNGIDGYLPKSAGEVAITAQVMKWMQRRPFRRIAEKKWFTTADAVSLPDYSIAAG